MKFSEQYIQLTSDLKILMKDIGDYLTKCRGKNVKID